MFYLTTHSTGYKHENKCTQTSVIITWYYLWGVNFNKSLFFQVLPEIFAHPCLDAEQGLIRLSSQVNHPVVKPRVLVHPRQGILGNIGRHFRERDRERNVLFNDALNTFYLRLYGVRHMVKDHSDSERGNPLPPHRLLLSINSKGSFICTIPQTG